MSDFTEEELAALSDEERAAIQDDENLEEAEATAEKAGDVQVDEPPAEGEPPAEDAAQAEDAAPAEDEQKEGDSTRDDQFVPRYQAEAPGDFDARMASISDAKRDLGQKYQDGEIDWAEFESQRDALDEQALDLREARSQADLMGKLTAQTEAQHWQWEQDRFFAQKSSQFYKDDELAYVALDHTIKRLAGDAANTGKPMSWFLEEADRAVRARFASPGGASKPVATKQQQPPPNLGDMPAAELQSTGNPDEFAHLDKLNGMELERAITKLSPEQQDRYLQG